MTDLRTYLPGDWFAVLGERATVLLPAGEKARVGRLWEMVDGGAGFDEVLDALISTGLRDLPGFVLVGGEDRSFRAVVRGQGRVVLDADEGRVTLDGTQAATWVERSVAGVTSMVIELGEVAQGREPSGRPLTIAHGLVRVSRLSVGEADAPPAAADEAADGAPAVAAAAYDAPEDAAVDEPAADEPAADEQVPDDTLAAEAPGPEPVVEPVAAGPQVVAEQEGDEQSTVAPEPVASEVPEQPDEEQEAQQPEPAGPASWPAPTAEQAVEPPGLAPAAPAGASAPVWGTPPAMPEPAWGAPPAPEPERPQDQQPGEPAWGHQPSSRQPTGKPAPQEPPAQAGHDDAETWSQPRPAADGQPQGGGAVWTPPGVRDGDDHGDDAGHDGDTQAGVTPPPELARQHPGLPGEPPPPSQVAQAVAKLVFSSGEVVEVDRPVIVGRAPEARQFTVTEQPHLVTVPSPQQEISSTHLEIRPGSGADSGTATVTDLGSTNGSVLVQPGLGPEDLQPGIAVSLLPGAIIDLGDSVTIQVAHP